MLHVLYMLHVLCSTAFWYCTIPKPTLGGTHLDGGHCLCVIVSNRALLCSSCSNGGAKLPTAARGPAGGAAAPCQDDGEDDGEDDMDDMHDMKYDDRMLPPFTPPQCVCTVACVVVVHTMASTLPAPVLLTTLRMVHGLHTAPAAAGLRW